LVCRLNDNTFVVFAAGLDAPALGTFARTLRDGTSRHQVSIEGELLRLRALVGYAALGGGFEDASTALAAAEQALRQARQLAVGIAAHEAPRAAAAVEADADRVVMIHDALMNNRFELAYQPIVAVAGGEE